LCATSRCYSATATSNAQYSQGLFTAEVAKDEVLKIQLQREQQIGKISTAVQQEINDEEAKGNSAAVKQAITKTTYLFRSHCN
jgi:hypothetical protein